LSFKELDRVEMSIDEMFKLLKWRDNHKEYVWNYKQVIPEGIVDVKGGMTIYFKFLDKTHTYYESYVDDDLFCKITTRRLLNYYTVEDVWTNEKMVKMMQQFDKSYNETDLVADVCTTVSSTMAYLEHFHSEVEIREEAVPMSNTQRKKAEWHNRNNPNEKVIKLKKVIYRIPNGASYSEKVRKEIQRHTESWSVRGHQRRLPNGKQFG
jgi:predicted ATP-binding protein involved in virulence